MMTLIQLLLLISIVICHSSFLFVEAFMGSLKNKEQPIRLRIHKKASQKVKTFLPSPNNNDSDGNSNQKDSSSWQLHEYMQLPAAQYACVPLPIKASLERVYGTPDEFTLVVPPISFPITFKSGGEIEITPKVRARVVVEPDRVTIQSLSCEIDGSPAVQEWNLNDRYDFNVCATLTWEKGVGHQSLLNNFIHSEMMGGNDSDEYDDDSDIESSTSSATISSSSSMDDSSIIPDASSSSSLSSDTTSTTTTTTTASSSSSSFQEDIIRIKTDLDIDVYVPPNVKRLKMIPKRLLAKIGNMVLNYVVGLLLEAFLEGLSSDYEQWASSPDYRKERQQLEHQLQLELQELKRQRLREEQRRRRQRRKRGSGGGGSRLEDDSSTTSPPRAPGGNNAFPFSNHLPVVGFLQRGRVVLAGQPQARSTTVAVANTATTTTAAHHHNHNKLRRGERIIRLIRRNQS